MNIQLSVMIWTVINFCILMLVLKFCLFNPIFRVMDARNKKIADAAAAKTEYDKKLALERENAKTEKLAAIAKAKKRAEKLIADTKAEAIADENVIKAECAKRIADEKTALEANRAALDEKLTGGMDRLVIVFADKFVS